MKRVRHNPCEFLVYLDVHRQSAPVAVVTHSSLIPIEWYRGMDVSSELS